MRFEVLRKRLFRTSFLMFAISSTNMSYASFLYSIERIFLPVSAQIHGLAQGVHGVEMLLPEAVDGVEDDVALQAHHRQRLLVGALQFVEALDLLDQKVRGFLGVFFSNAPAPP